MRVEIVDPTCIVCDGRGSLAVGSRDDLNARQYPCRHCGGDGRKKFNCAQCCRSDLTLVTDGGTCAACGETVCHQCRCFCDRETLKLETEGVACADCGEIVCPHCRCFCDREKTI